MQFYLITNNNDTAIGMRLAGIPYTLVSSAKEYSDAMSDAIRNKNISIILITQGIYAEYAEFTDEIKKNTTLPLITVIPEAGSEFKSDALTRYVADAMGIVG